METEKSKWISVIVIHRLDTVGEQFEDHNFGEVKEDNNL